ncbi:MAG: hypothetical protein COX81_00385 [Candidatus Magasanikbacteria bacterium CG_4_10_14_0_2_um_filter_37_12]|uniref:Amino acid transporter transmembrane domain-containing protein n=1 Tax=Candidatus Magasanikbacteria bacterium CG_4_10_14_0_2_um_filter_37_12 TaxID=1974637 RepID=A0A2M7V9X8_9BACT|nr:MAG: hypothetical protein COX81_00385 [Candidatus Magasanikbacteria bacterium CG_4_10_14_0_2_um_filter_37_12]
MASSNTRKEVQVKQRHGIFRKELNLWQAVALIVSGTIGAGVLAIPYAVSKVGMSIGLVYIVLLGLLMIGLNLFVGELSAKTKQDLQLVGLAKRYFGHWGEYLMSAIYYSILFGVLLVYIVGEGEVLAVLFGGTALLWSFLFFLIATLVIATGMRTVKTVELVLTFGILLVVLAIALLSSTHISIGHLETMNLAYLFFPFGIVLFAFHGTNAVPEAHALLKDKNTLFKKAIVISGLISIVVYALFAFAIVGVTGWGTTEIATIGFGQSVGPLAVLFGNLFAALAMGTSYILVGLSLRDSFHWDYKVPVPVATALVSIIPAVLFFIGSRHFIAIVDFVGGVFISFEMLFILVIYWRAKHVGDLTKSKFKLHHVWLLFAILVFVLSVGAFYSLTSLFVG